MSIFNLNYSRHLSQSCLLLYKHEVLAFFKFTFTPSLSQREFAESLVRVGIELDKNAIQRIESGQRFVTDIELTAMAKIFGVAVEELTITKSIPIPYNRVA